MASERKFYRTVIQVEVLSEVPYPVENKELSDVAYDITEGDCNGKVITLSSNQKISGHEAARRLIESGSDPGFFRLTENGEDDDEED